ncbi:MAG: LytTR family DNA-binding domain-containing protein [Acutalibacteraceae bacterium]|nr:LytTR family DNA-binding domain-containing protein [Acutalibacteraceae bacterium]
MKCEIIIDDTCEEKVVIFSKENNRLVNDIKQFVEQCSTELIGYKNKEIIKLNSADVFCITVIDNKVYAVCQKEKFEIKTRLYVIEEKLPENFIKINQSCIANINQIERFDASISGTLKIRFKNGYTDYVSRRQLKNVKERIGI